MVSFEGCRDDFVIVFMSPEIVSFNASLTEDCIKATVRGNVVALYEIVNPENVTHGIGKRNSSKTR